jgi:hypothetical protein
VNNVNFAPIEVTSDNYFFVLEPIWPEDKRIKITERDNTYAANLGVNAHARTIRL